MIEFQDLTKTYGLLRAVEGLSLRVEPGEVYALLGPNGAGEDDRAPVPGHATGTDLGYCSWWAMPMCECSPLWCVHASAF